VASVRVLAREQPEETSVRTYVSRHTIEPAQDGERQEDPAVLVRLIRAAEQVRHRPDECNFLRKVRHREVPGAIAYFGPMLHLPFLCVTVDLAVFR
jgi:hypothetical protein